MEFDLLKCWLLFVRSTRHRAHNRVHGIYVTHAYQEANMDKWMNQTRILNLLIFVSERA